MDDVLDTVLREFIPTYQMVSPLPDIPKFAILYNALCRSAVFNCDALSYVAKLGRNIVQETLPFLFKQNTQDVHEKKLSSQTQQADQSMQTTFTLNKVALQRQSLIPQSIPIYKMRTLAHTRNIIDHV